MRRLGLYLLLTVLLAACSSAPMRTATRSGAETQYSSRTTGNNRSFAPPAGFPMFVDHSVGSEEISIEAMSLVGVPYRWGGNTPDSGFDCSGLVDYVVRRAAAVNLPRTTDQMGSAGSPVNPDEIAPGDLIFFNTTGRAHSHVGIYVGQYRFVNAPSTGGTVRLDYVTNPYWAKRFDGIRRVAQGLSPVHPAPFDGRRLEAAVAPRTAEVASVYSAASEPAPRSDQNTLSLQLAAPPASGNRDSADTAALAIAAPGGTGRDTSRAAGAPGAVADPIAQFANTGAAPGRLAGDSFGPVSASASSPESAPPPAGAIPLARTVNTEPAATPAAAGMAADPIAGFASGKF